jgi:Zn-dependent peptidase ImmA (M78 family)/transcriptional regulator with XRE-family HTH domain
MEMSTSPFPYDEQQRVLLNPERVRCARETACLSKSQLAGLLGVTPRTIANYENDGAPESQARELSLALDVRPSYFIVHPHDPEIEELSDTQVWFRSVRKSTVRQRKSAVGHGRNALLLFRWVTDHFRLPESDLPVEDGAHMSPQEAAYALRGDWGYGENALPDMTALAEAHGIRLFSLPSVGKEVDAFSFVFEGNPYVAVDLQKTAERVRFDIAHEIGHLMMHEPALDELAVSGARRDIESEAHSFAANLLMPERRVKSMISSHASLNQILEAKRYFKVSAMAMARRAHELGRLSDWDYRAMCSNLTAKGFRSGEPDGIKLEQSKIFRFIAKTNQSNGISTTTISEETGLWTDELHDLSFGNLMGVTKKNTDLLSVQDDADSFTKRPELGLRINKKQ